MFQFSKSSIDAARGAAVSRLAGAIAIAALAAGSAHATEAKLPATPPQQLVEAVRAGGHVLFIRHVQTDKEGADQVDAKMGDCSTQRTLSEAGWRDAALLRAGFEVLNIPVAAVVSSQYCRAWQTAELVFGRHVKRAELNFEPAETYTDAQKQAMRSRVAPLLATVPPQGFNTVLVGHDDPFDAATGIYPEPMGVLVVAKPDGKGGFTLLGEIKPDQWGALLAGR
jgi:phosphohistidine phosphatase SixA